MGIRQVSIIRVIKGDTRSLDYSLLVGSGAHTLLVQLPGALSRE